MFTKEEMAERLIMQLKYGNKNTIPYWAINLHREVVMKDAEAWKVAQEILKEAGNTPVLNKT